MVAGNSPSGAMDCSAFPCGPTLCLLAPRAISGTACLEAALECGSFSLLVHAGEPAELGQHKRAGPDPLPHWPLVSGPLLFRCRSALR
jgi:hypothetical protein